MTDRVIGAEWASKGVGSVQALKDSTLTRSACIICGHPTNDCTGHAPLPTSTGESNERVQH